MLSDFYSHMRSALILHYCCISNGSYQFRCYLVMNVCPDVMETFFWGGGGVLPAAVKCESGIAYRV